MCPYWREKSPRIPRSFPFFGRRVGFETALKHLSGREAPLMEAMLRWRRKRGDSRACEAETKTRERPRAIPCFRFTPRYPKYTPQTPHFPPPTQHTADYRALCRVSRRNGNNLFYLQFYLLYPADIHLSNENGTVLFEHRLESLGHVIEKGSYRHTLNNPEKSGELLLL